MKALSSYKISICVERSCVGFAALSMLWCNAFGEVDSGCRYAELSLKMLHATKAKEWMARVYTAAFGFSLVWKQPFSDQLNHILCAYRSALGTGDIEVSYFCSIAVPPIVSLMLILFY